MQAVELMDGNVVLVGYTDGSWEESAGNAGNNDFVMVVLDANATAATQDPPNPGASTSSPGTSTFFGTTKNVVLIAVAVAAILIFAGVWLGRRRIAKLSKRQDVTPASSPIRSLDAVDEDQDPEIASTTGEADLVERGNDGRSGSFGGASWRDREGVSDIARATLDAAAKLASNCHVPGISEAANLMSIAANLVSDRRSISEGHEKRLKRCKATIDMLQDAAVVLATVRRWYNSRYTHLFLPVLTCLRLSVTRLSAYM